MYYIYKIENEINGKKYIGLTNNIARRRARHFTDLRCKRHDNSFLQKEFNIYKEECFSFSIEFAGDVSEEEISEKEKYFIKYYDSYRNGYNQNEGGNFKVSNGGSHLTQSDIFNILAALEFTSKPGQVLANIYGVSRTTISRIKRGENHSQYKEEYDNLPFDERKHIYNIFCESSNFVEQKLFSTVLKEKRKLDEKKVHLILCNFEFNCISRVEMAKLVGVSSTYTLDCIKKGLTYKDYSFTYNKLSNEQKLELASLLRNQ